MKRRVPVIPVAENGFPRKQKTLETRSGLTFAARFRQKADSATQHGEVRCAKKSSYP